MSFLEMKNLDSMKSLFKYTLILGVGISLSACDLAANMTKSDRAADMEIQDFRDGLAERLPEVSEEDNKSGANDVASIPQLQTYLSTESNTVEAMPLVSIASAGTVSLREILYELARQAEYDLELDPNIQGSVIFTARDKPFDLVIERLSDMAGLRYKFDDGFLRVEVDTPFHKIYKIDYLSFVRTNEGGVSTNVAVVSGDGADTGSNYASSSNSTSDFWGELDLNLQQLLGGVSTGALKTSYDPRVTAAQQNPDVAAVSPQTPSAADGGVDVQPPQAVLNVEALPVDIGGANTSSESGGNVNTFSINKQAGLISVFGTHQAQKAVEEYLTVLRRSVTAQVLVEAKVFEVSLYDEFIHGIEWQGLIGGEGIVALADADEGFDSFGEFVGGLTTAGGDFATDTNFALGWAGNDVSAFVEAISGFGTVRALASPRMTVMNNQSAVLNVATNRVYFELEITREIGEGDDPDTVEVDTDIKTVPEGVLINVQPSINLDKRTISMNIRPTITRITRFVEDPGVQFVTGSTGIQSEIPEVNVQEIETVVKVNSGQPIVMGGLIQDRTSNTEEGVPVLSELPLFGAAFKQKNDLTTKTELVIFLKATVLENPSDSIHNTDRDLYKTFSGDRRPFKL